MRAIQVSLAALLVGVFASISVVQSQETGEAPVFTAPAAVLYNGKVVFEVPIDGAIEYFLVQNGVRRAITLDAVRSHVEIVGIDAAEMASIPLGPDAYPTLPPLSLAYATPTGTVTLVPTPTPRADLITVSGVSTVVAWGTPGPVFEIDGENFRPPIEALEAGRLNGEDVAFAGLPSGDLLRYRHNSGTWEDLTPRLGLSLEAVGGALLVSTSDPPLVLYATSERTNGSTTLTVHRSTDGGENWSRQTVPGASARTFHQVPGRPDSIFMGTNEGVVRSLDRGQSWTLLRGCPTFGIDLPSVGFVAWAIAADPNQSADVYAGGAAIEGTGQVRGRLFRSRDGGDCWVEIIQVSGESSFPTILTMTFDPTIQGRLIVGLDGGAGIVEVGPPGTQREQQAVFPPTATPTLGPGTPSATPTATPNEYVIRTIGATQMQHVADLGFRPRPAEAGGASAGVVSRENGVTVPVATITTRADGGFNIPQIGPGEYELVITGAPRPPELYAAALPSPLGGTGGQGGVYLSYDGGLNWVDVTADLDTRIVGSVAFSPDGRLIYVGAGAPPITLQPGPGGVVVGTTN